MLFLHKAKCKYTMCWTKYVRICLSSQDNSHLTRHRLLLLKCLFVCLVGFFVCFVCGFCFVFLCAKIILKLLACYPNHSLYHWGVVLWFIFLVVSQWGRLGSDHYVSAKRSTRLTKQHGIWRLFLLSSSWVRSGGVFRQQVHKGREATGVRWAFSKY